MNYTFKYKINIKDHYDFNVYQHFNNPILKKRIILRRIIYPLFFMIVGIKLSIGEKNGFIIFAYFIIVSILWIIFLNKIVKYNIKKSVELTKKDTCTTTTLCFNDEYIMSFTEGEESKIQYSIFTKIVKGKSAYYFHTSDFNALIIPFIIFDNNEIMMRFIEYISEKTNLKIIN